MKNRSMSTPFTKGSLNGIAGSSSFNLPLTKLIVTITISILSIGCVRHIQPYEPKVRVFEPADYAAPNENRSAGSLWSDSSSSLFEDDRAKRVGDIINIVVDERSDATRDAATSTSSQSETSFGVTSFLGALAKLKKINPDIDTEKLLAAASQAEFDGKGKTTRSGKISAVLGARIKQVLPNGDFFIEGSKVLLLNDEESFLYMSGVIRPFDIQPDNSINSSRMSDVELEFTGRGVISDRQSPGWLARVFDHVWPF